MALLEQEKIVLHRRWMAAFWLLFLLLSGGCGNNVQKTGNLPAPKDPPLAFQWKYLQRPLNAVFFIDSNTGWGVGSQGVVLATRDGGATWEPKPSGTQATLSDVWFADAKTGWAVGSEGVFATRDGGSTWSLQDKSGSLGTIYFAGSRTGWALGPKGLIIATKDGGSSWKRQAAPKEAEIRSAHFLNADLGWIVGSGGTIFATRDGGHQWVLQKSPVPEDLSSVFFLDDRLGWISYEKGVLHTADGGEHWVANPWPSVKFLKLHFTSALQGKAIALRPRADLPSATERVLLSTVDGARTWTETERLDADGSFRFLDGRTGYALRQENGGVFWTADGGASWEPRWKVQPRRSIKFLDSNQGWGLDSGGRLLVTKDGGTVWNPAEGAEAPAFLSVHFVDAAKGWAVTKDHNAVSTVDGGNSWQPAGGPGLEAVYFMDTQTGWAVGGKGAILKTENGGLQWNPQASGIDQKLMDVLFVDRERGWAVGDMGLILATIDGGKTWTQQTEARGDTFLLALAFANSRTGWAVGYRLDRTGSSGLFPSPFVWIKGLVLATKDGGKSWAEERELLVRGFAYRAAGFRPPDKIRMTGTREFFVGPPPLALEGQISGRGPSVQSFQTEDQPDDSVLLTLRVRDENPQTVELSRLEFRSGPAAEWSPVRLEQGLMADPAGVISVPWEPQSYGIGEGREIAYRLVLREQTGLAFAQEIPGTFVYRSWWSRQPNFTQGAILGGGILAGYAAVCLVLLWLAPLALLWVHQHVPIQDLLDEVPSKGAGVIAKTLLEVTGLPTLVRHRRTRRAWESRYRAGRTNLSDLPASLRSSYIEDPGFLDAWVERRATDASAALSRIDAVDQRRVYIELPVRVGSREDGRLLPDPPQPEVGKLFAAPCAVLAILGEGGTGKSTLACQIARWALADEPALRLASHRMIPVFLLEETRDLLGSITGQLRSMVGSDEMDEDVVLCLLRSKRLLVIVDALSECTPEMQRHVESIHRSVSVNALVVTARRRPDFGPVPLVEIWPEKISPEKLVYFLVEYLRRTRNDEIFPDRQGIQLADRLLGLVEGGGRDVTVTPLLIKLFVEQAIALRRAGEPLERLPSSIAETMLESLRRTNPPNPEAPNWVDNATLIRAARILGRCSLEGDYIPRDFFRDTAEAELAREGVLPEGADVIARLVDNGILRELDRGGTRILRFTLDPLAEYMAALSWLDRLRGDQVEWEKWLAELRATKGFPERMRGFLIALDDCVLTYKMDFQIPQLDLSWKP